MQVTGYVFSADFALAGWVTLSLTIVSMLIGSVIGLLLALAKTSGVRPLRLGTNAYIWLFRGTPVLLQLIFIFNVLPRWGLRFDSFNSAVIALSLNEGAYMAEIIRAGLQSVDRGQHVAARILGLSEFQILRWVVIPQAARVIIPPWGNQCIGMLKTSALASVIAVQDLLLTAESRASANFDYVNTLLAAAFYYLLFTTVFTVVQTLVERHLDITRKGAGARTRASGPDAPVAIVEGDAR